MLPFFLPSSCLAGKHHQYTRKQEEGNSFNSSDQSLATSLQWWPKGDA